MYEFKNKEANVAQLNKYMLAKTRAMFVWDGLPTTLPSSELEKILQTNGWAFITEVGGELYAFKGSFGGVEDAYGNPTQITINNVGLNFNKTMDLTDGVLIYSDSSAMGLLPLFNKLHLAQVETELTMIIQSYNERLSTLISASDDRTKESAEKFLEKIVGGELAVIGESPLLSGITSHDKGRPSPITQTIEYHQYLKGTLANEIGLRAATNMKRERLLQDEVSQNDDTTYPFIHNMLACRELAVEQINEKFGLTVEVDFGSIWAVRHVKLMVQGEVEVADVELDDTVVDGSDAGTDVVVDVGGVDDVDVIEPQILLEEVAEVLDAIVEVIEEADVDGVVEVFDEVVVEAEEVDDETK